MAKPVGVTHSARPVVAPGCDLKSGCGWCPLLPWSADFGGSLLQGFNRDADKVLGREPDGHTVHNRNVSETWSVVDILFVGEAPGAAEDKAGLPFVGQSGKLLRDVIKACLPDFPAERLGFTNVVRCRPPRNRDPNKTELQSCAPEIERELVARKPKVVVALGGTALKALTGQTGILNLTGRRLACTVPGSEDLPVVACLHPAYVSRFDHETERFAEAILTAHEVLTGEAEELLGIGEYFTLTELEQVEAFFDSVIELKTKVFYDTETGSLQWWDDEHPHLLCFSFSDEDGIGITVPFDHAESPWRVGGPKEHERPKLIKILQGFFTDPTIPKGAQNEKFDRNHIREALGVEPVNVTDTMSTHLVLDERRGSHGLKTLAYTETGMGGYETELEKYIAAHDACNPEKSYTDAAGVIRKGSYANIPGPILFRYAGMDADCTGRVDGALRSNPEFVENERFQVLSDVFLPALSAVLADMEWAGAQVDPDVVVDLDVRYTLQMEKLLGQIVDLPEVQQYVAYRKATYAIDGDAKKAAKFAFNPSSVQQLQEILFAPEFCGEKPVHLTKTGLERISLRLNAWGAKWQKDRKGKKPEFIDVVLHAIEEREWQHFATDAEVLQELDRRGNKLANLILDYRAVSTLHGTFVAPLSILLDPEGRIHGTYLLHGTVTGRLASANPNLMNIPNKGGGLIKRAYVSRFGDEGLIAQLDFSQVELRIAASIFNEPTMIEAYVTGADIHALTAVDISGLTAEEYAELSDYDRKAWRTRSKRVNFGCLYGGGPPALQHTLRKDGVFLSIDECQDLLDRFWAKRPALRYGIRKLEEGVRKLGYLESFTGRRRRVPEVNSEDEQLVARALRQAGNFPVQSGASDMTLISLVLIHREMQRRKLRSLMVLTVHDSIVFDVHVDEFAEVLQLAKAIMESLPKLAAKVWPGIDWSWLKTPIIADCEVGASWGTLVEVKDPNDIDLDDLWDRMAVKAAA